MTEQELNRSQIARLLVYLSRLCSPHRMRAISIRLQADGLHPAFQQPTVLPGGDMRIDVGSAFWRPRRLVVLEAVKRSLSVATSGEADVRPVCNFADTKRTRGATLHTRHSTALKD